MQARPPGGWEEPCVCWGPQADLGYRDLRPGGRCQSCLGIQHLPSEELLPCLGGYRLHPSVRRCLPGRRWQRPLGPRGQCLKLGHLPGATPWAAPQYPWNERVPWKFCPLAPLDHELSLYEEPCTERTRRRDANAPVGAYSAAGALPSTLYMSAHLVCTTVPRGRYCAIPFLEMGKPRHKATDQA